MPETLTEKIGRHLKQGHVDPATLLRGLNQIADHSFMRRELYGRLETTHIAGNFLGVEGLRLATYELVMPEDSLSTNLMKSLMFRTDPLIHVIEFPYGSRFNLFLDQPGNLVYTEAFFLKCQKRQNPVGAAFTGPTYDFSSKYPNNGFYSQSSGLQVEFRDTNPSGLSRGAFGITADGALIVMEDDLKWALVREGFPGVKALIGTSYYFTQGDDIEYDGPSKSQSSYLVSYKKSPEEEARVCFVLSEGVVTRSTMKAVIDNYVASADGLGYIAVEMEFTGASCFVRGQDGLTQHFGGSGFIRADHYGVLFPKDDEARPSLGELESVMKVVWRRRLSRDF